MGSFFLRKTTHYKMGSLLALDAVEYIHMPNFLSNLNQNEITLIIILLLSISEAMAISPIFKSNGILHFLINVLKALKRNLKGNKNDDIKS